MADPTNPKSGGGCFSTLILIVFLVVAIGLGAAVFFIARPQDLSDLGGYGPAAKGAPVKDVRAVLKNSLDRGFPVTLTEADLNIWLDRTLSRKQGGLLASQISLERVWVRLENGFAEVIMERKVMNQPFTVSMFIRIEKVEGPKGLSTEVNFDGGPFHPDAPQPPRGGRFGKLVVPQGFLILVKPAYEKLAALFPEEKKLGIEEMARIKIEKGRMILNPRAPAEADSLLPKTF
ncbi:MAG: hypothetical protein ABIT37_16735 [Luteolibacter sp.]